MLFQQAKWQWRLDLSPSEHNEYYKLKLSGAWKPLCSHYSLSRGEGKSSQNFVSYGNKINSR